MLFYQITIWSYLPSWVKDDDETEKLNAEFQALQAAISGAAQPAAAQPTAAVTQPAAATVHPAAVVAQPVAAQPVVAAAAEKKPEEKPQEVPKVEAKVEAKVEPKVEDKVEPKVEPKVEETKPQAEPVATAPAPEAKGETPSEPTVAALPAAAAVVVASTPVAAAPVDTKELQALRAELEELRKKSASEEVRWQEKLRSAESSASAATKSQETTLAELNKKNGELATKEQEIAKKDQDLKALHEKLASAADQLTKAVLSQGDLQDKISALKARRAEREAELQAEVDSHKAAQNLGTDERLLALSTQLQAQRATAEEREKSLRKQLKEAASSLKEKAAAHDDLNHKLHQHAEQLRKLREENEELRTAQHQITSDFTSKLFETGGLLQDATAAREEEAARAARLEEELKKSEEELKKSKDELEQFKAELSAFKAELSEVKAEKVAKKERHHRRASSKAGSEDKDDKSEEKEPAKEGSADDKEEIKRLTNELDATQRKLSQMNAMLDYARKTQDDQEARLRNMQAAQATKCVPFSPLISSPHPPSPPWISPHVSGRAADSLVGRRNKTTPPLLPPLLLRPRPLRSSRSLKSSSSSTW